MSLAQVSISKGSTVLELRMKWSLLCKTRHTIVSNRGRNLPNMWTVFAQHVGSICPTCGQYLPNMLAIFAQHVQVVFAGFAQHKGCICPTYGLFLPNRRTLLSNCWANAICWALCTRVGQKFLGTTSLCIARQKKPNKIEICNSKMKLSLLTKLSKENIDEFLDSYWEAEIISMKDAWTTKF